MRVAICTCCVLTWIVHPGASICAAEYAAMAVALASIDREDLAGHVNVLADDTFEGREAGSRGGRAAAGYIIDKISKSNVKSAGIDGTWFQLFDPNHRNLLAMIEGSDPELKKQFIIVGAHYDHVGYGTPQTSYGPLGYIHNGADDNASGAAAVMEVIEAFDRLGQAPRRSILFTFWDGEEKGLLGSKYWISRPTVPLDQVPLAINLDMIGRLRNNNVEITGTRTTWGLRQLVSRQAQDSGLTFNFTWKIAENSDHWPFYAKKKPILMFHTGLHNDYHRPSDDVEKVNKEGMEIVARVMFRVIVELADRDTLPSFRPSVSSEQPFALKQLEASLPPLPSRLGVWWDDKSAPGKEGLSITRVVAGSPAATADIRVGDLLTRCNGEPLVQGDDLRAAVLAAKTNLPLELLRSGQAEPIKLDVKLAGLPVRVGISWRTDEAEPSAVHITRVVPGSPADRAGLQPRDRIYAIGGESFENSDAFQQKLTALSGRIDLLCERNGLVTIKPIDLPPAKPASE